MPSNIASDVKFEIGHVLFIDIVGYSKLLMREGLARAHGIGRKRPDGISAKDYRQHLNDVELQAAIKRQGAWKLADFDRIAEIREEQRREKRKIDEQVTDRKARDEAEETGEGD